MSSEDIWFEDWYKEEAVQFLKAVYTNPDKNLEQIREDELDVGHSIYRRLKDECRERGLLKTQRGQNLGRERVTDKGRRFLLQHDTNGFLKDKARAVIEG